jgi:hypothetical protein
MQYSTFEKNRLKGQYIPVELLFITKQFIEISLKYYKVKMHNCYLRNCWLHT